MTALLLLAAIAALAGSYYAAPLRWAPLLVSLERTRSGLQQRHATVDHRTFRYLDGGQGVVVVMVHGFGGNSDHWVRMASALVKRFRVVAPDLPGFGDTPASTSERFSISLQTERLHALLQALGIRRYHLVGNSMGGNIAGALAHDHPDEVASLTLIEPQGIESRTPTALDLEIAQGLVPLVPEQPKDFDRLLDLLFVKRPFIPRAVYLLLRQRALAAAPLHRVIWNDLWDPASPYPLEHNLSGIRAPTLVIWGDSNRFLHDTAIEKLERGLRDLRVVRMTACGHAPMLERPAEVAAHFEAFLASLARPATAPHEPGAAAR